jgi:hypothetical protein
MFCRRCTLVLTAFVMNFLLAIPCYAQLAPITFPDVDGWVKGTRYDEEPPRVKAPRSTIAYTTKDKVGNDYIRTDVQIHPTEGKEMKDLIAVQEKAILENPIMKNVKKTEATEVKVGDVKIPKLSYSASKGLNNPVVTELYVIPYDKWYIHLVHTGPVADEKQRTAETAKLIEALVGAAK